MTLVYFHGDRTRKEIALTFDDGPCEQTKEILKILKEEEIPATFFICGKKIQNNRRVIKQMIKQGCEIGNHTFNHISVWFKSKERFGNEIKKTDDELKKLKIKTNLFRPPYCRFGFGFLVNLKKLNKKIIIGDVISGDWKKISVQKKIETILRKTRNGSIIILHDYLEDIGENRDIIDIILPVILELKRRGFKFKKVSEIIG
jgi:chitin deacetylase